MALLDFLKNKQDAEKSRKPGKKVRHKSFGCKKRSEPQPMLSQKKMFPPVKTLTSKHMTNQELSFLTRQ